MSDLETILHAVTNGFQQVNMRLDRLEERVGNLEADMREVKQRVGNLETKTDSMEKEMRSEFADVRSRLDALQHTVDRIEHHQQDEVVGMLRLVKGKTEIHEHKIDSLNKRLLEVEAHIQKVVNQ